MGKRELVFLLLFICNYVVSVRRGFLFHLVLGIGCFIVLWHSLGLPYNNSYIPRPISKLPLTIKMPWNPLVESVRQCRQNDYYVIYFERLFMLILSFYIFILNNKMNYKTELTEVLSNPGLSCLPFCLNLLHAILDARSCRLVRI